MCDYILARNSLKTSGCQIYQSKLITIFWGLMEMEVAYEVCYAD